LADLEKSLNRKGAVNFIQNLFLRPRIFHKGLLLVLIPLVCQTGLLLFVNQEITASEQTMLRSRRLSDMMMYSLMVQLDFVRATVAQAIYLFTQKAAYQNLASKIFNLIDAHFEKMKELAGSDQEWSSLVEQSRLVRQHQKERLLKLNPGESPDAAVQELSKITEFSERSTEAAVMRERSSLLSTQEVSTLESMEAKQARATHALSILLVWSIPANFMLGSILLLIFSKNISGRLGLLIDNASRLSSHEKLKNLVKGRDELSFLDLVLHQAKSQIDAASMRRTQIMSSLAEDMSAPLRAAQQDLRDFARLEGDGLQKECIPYLERSRGNVEHVVLLIEDLLSLESLTIGKIELEKTSVDLKDVAENAIASIASVAQKKKITLQNNCTNLAVVADKRRLIQVLVNYISNAIKFSQKGTTVTVSAEQLPNSIRVIVTDEGPGMDESTRLSVFEKFFQASTEQKKQGFGLGLAICKLIIESHNGTLGVQSEPGHGSKFWFELPT